MKWLLILTIVFFSSMLEEAKEKMSDSQNRVKSFLQNISRVESSNGDNTNHQMIQSGIHKGQRAIGRYGLMPNTVNEVLNRMRIHGGLSPDLQALEGLDPQTMKETLESNPEMEDKIAETLATRVLSRQQDEDKAAYSWNHGHNLSPDEIDAQPYQESDYVKKYNAYKKLATNGEDQ